MARNSADVVYSRLAETPIVPLFFNADQKIAENVLKACYDGGIRVFEFTNRGEAAPAIFAKLIDFCEKECPDLVLGIGTIFDEKQAKEFNTIINTKGYKSAIYNTDLDNAAREENLNNFKNGNLNVLVSCTALDEGFDMPEADGAMILSASSSKRQRIQRMGRVLRITANKENALIVTVYSSNTEYVKLKEESNRYQLENVPIRWQQMK